MSGHVLTIALGNSLLWSVYLLLTRHVVSGAQLDAWADDLKVGLERELKELDRRLTEIRPKSKGAATLSEKLDAQKDQRELEGQRDKKRRELFTRQDEIQARRDSLIDELEGQLQQKIVMADLFSCQWVLV